jgi:hypothetical protein
VKTYGDEVRCEVESAFGVALAVHLHYGIVKTSICTRFVAQEKIVMVAGHDCE